MILEICICMSDVFYLLDKDDVIWGFLLLIDELGGKLVVDWIKSCIVEVNIEEFVVKYCVKLEFWIGIS